MSALTEFWQKFIVNFYADDNILQKLLTMDDGVKNYTNMFDMEKIIKRFYQLYNIANEDEIPLLLKKYRSCENILFTNLYMNYTNNNLKINEKLWFGNDNCHSNPQNSLLTIYPVALKKFIINDVIFSVFDDGELLGGTKRRLLTNMLPHIKAGEIVYAGPDTGAAQIALAICAKENNKRATIFLQGSTRNKTAQSILAESYGANLVYSDTGRTLKDTQLAAQQYVQNNNDRYLMSFGMKDSKGTLIYDIFLQTMKETFAVFPQPQRLWITSGSGFILEILHEIWSNTNFMVIQVGRTIWPDQLREGDRLFVSVLPFFRKTNILPPYKSVQEYDAKLWEFFLQHGKSGDCIFNVAAI